jgi:hypothetical protein
MGNDNGLVHCVLEGVDDLDDKALLKHLKGVATVHTRNALMNLYENLLEIKSKSSARVARLLCMNFSNQLSTVTASPAPAASTKRSKKDSKTDTTCTSNYNGPLKVKSS